MAGPICIPISNVPMSGDYTGKIAIGPNQIEIDVLLDTGSSTLAIDSSKYTPHFTEDDEVQTNLAQVVSYGDGSNWTGAVVNTTVSLGTDGNVFFGVNVPVAVAYQASSDMWGQSGGILGLAFQPLDDAFTMTDKTWDHQYTRDEIKAGQATTVVPCLVQMTNEGVLPERMGFYTRRSYMKAGPDPASDPDNQGWLVLGDCDQATQLFTPPFQSVRVLADLWYCTNLKGMMAGQTCINVSSQAAMGMPSNSIVDSGTNSLNLGPTLIQDLFATFSDSQRALLQSALQGNAVSNADIGDLSQWPTIGFVLEGTDPNADVTLNVAPRDYWQCDVGQVGQAALAITQGQDGSAILGLPLMNGYYTIFDATVAPMGVILFAPRT
jgi:Eukaryotic aspartyl protease